MLKRVRGILCVVVLLICFSTIAQAESKIKDPDKNVRRLAKWGTVVGNKKRGDARVSIRDTRYVPIDISNYGLDDSLQYFHGMFYRAKIKGNLTTTTLDKKKEKVKVKKGEEVIAIGFLSRSPKAKVLCRLKSKKDVYIPIKYIDVTGYIYNSARAYSDAQVEAWVKANKITSKTKYMFVVSRYNQHGWIMVKKKGNWVCKYVLGVSTAVYPQGGIPNEIYGLNSCSINTHYVGCTYGKGISYASKTGGNHIHIGTPYQPSTHGCIGLTQKDLNFVYYYLPYGTRVVTF